MIGFARVRTLLLLYHFGDYHGLVLILIIPQTHIEQFFYLFSTASN